MATLILEQGDRRRGAVLNGRVVIGRRTNNHITIRDRTVSRIHAWIGQTPGGYFVSDSGSRTGTRINGELMRGRRPLHEGDEIQIGPLRIIYHSNGTLPADIEMLDVSDRPLAGDDGVFVDCTCGAPIWAPWEYAGRSGRCRDCDRIIKLPSRSAADVASDASNDTMAPDMPATVAHRAVGGVPGAPAIDAIRLEDDSSATAEKVDDRPRPSRPLEPGDDFARPATTEAKPAPEVVCGACQSSISMLEQTTYCPECGVAFHADCWTENGGCSSYGCKQVNILAPPPAKTPTIEPEPVATVAAPAVVDELAAPAAPPERAVQWGYLLLPASMLAALLSSVSFGGPSLLLAIGIVIYGMRHPRRSNKVSGFALLISTIAAAAGSAFSTYWWFVASAKDILHL
jgi:hypothetical protein